jgi:hypothetical protein
MRYMSRWLTVPAVLALTGGLALAGCGSSHAGPQVPSISGHSQGAGAGRAAALHAVAQCVREHGIPTFPDPILTSTGRVYFDLRSIQDASRGQQDEAQHACGGLAAHAGFNPTSEPPAPPQLVAAGVAAARCMRANGMTAMSDPTASTMYVPGHGFSLTPDEVPAGGKADPAWRRAVQACSHQVDAEIRASTLASLGDD